MKNKYVSLVLITSMFSLGLSCKHQRTSQPQDESGTIQSETSDTQNLQRKGQKPGGKGQGPRAGGRGYGRQNGKGMQRIEGIALTEEETKAVEIQTAKTSYLPLRSQLSAMGKVIAPQQRKAIVSYAFPARISQIHIRIGDWVKKGQKLVTLQSEEVGSAKSEFYKARADYELAQINSERQKRLFDRGVGAKKDFLTSEADLKIAQVNLNAAEKKLHVLGFSEEEIKIISETHQINPVISLYAAIEGKIIQNNAVLGAMVDQATEILVIMNPTVLWIDAEIYEKDIAKIRLGQKVEVSVPAYPGEKFTGKITYISDVLKEDTRTITVRSDVGNKGMKLKPGMFADVKILLNHQNRALVVPQEAILEDKGDKIVFIKRNNQYFLQVVKTGTKENGQVEILQGLMEGDEVVTAGNYQLKSKLYNEILKKAHVH